MQINAQKLTDILSNELQINNNALIHILTSIIKSHYITNYNSLKELVKLLKVELDNYNYIIKHTILLNIISKNLGFKNHHSLKNINTVSNDFKNIDIHKSSNLMKFFLIRDKVFKKYSIKKWRIYYFLNNKIDFHFMNEENMDTTNKSNLKKLYKEVGLKPYFNTISFFKLNSKELQVLSYKIISYNKNFFVPYWDIENDDRYGGKVIRNEWNLLAYNNFELKLKKDLNIVDNLSMDLHWNVITNYINYLMTFGTIDDVRILELLIEGKAIKSLKSISLLQKEAINKWELYNIEHHIDENIEKSRYEYNEDFSLRTTLDNLDMNLNIQNCLYPYFTEFEYISGKSIKNLMIDITVYFSTLKYTKKEILNKVSLELYNIKYKDLEIDILNQINSYIPNNCDTEYSKNYYIISAIKYISDKIVLLLNCYLKDRVIIYNKTTQEEFENSIIKAKYNHGYREQLKLLSQKEFDNTDNIKLKRNAMIKIIYAYYFRSLYSANNQKRKHPDNFKEYASHYLYANLNRLRPGSDISIEIQDYLVKEFGIADKLKIKKGYSYYYAKNY